MARNVFRTIKQRNEELAKNISKFVLDVRRPEGGRKRNRQRAGEGEREREKERQRCEGTHIDGPAFFTGKMNRAIDSASSE